MFSRQKNYMTDKISLISSIWMVMVVAMLATTFTLYQQQFEKSGPQYPQVSARYQYMNYY